MKRKKDFRTRRKKLLRIPNNFNNGQQKLMENKQNVAQQLLRVCYSLIVNNQQ